MILRGVASGTPRPCAYKGSSPPIGNPFLTEAKGRNGYEAAWAVIARTQSRKSERYLLVSQPDHARLSGDLAARFEAYFLPKLDEAAIEAIGLHDAGWAEFEFESDCRIDPPLNQDGRPQSFIEFPPRVFLNAWKGSIEAGAQVSTLGGLMVSGHFCRLGKGRLHAQVDSAADAALVREFLAAEEERQSKLRKELKLSPQQAADYVDVLQFCDVLSLYLCCGTTERAEFPQCFAGKHLKIEHRNGEFAITPSPFTRNGEEPPVGIRFHVPARLFPRTDAVGPQDLEFVVR